MKKEFDPVTGITTWKMTKWYNKTILVLGYVYTVIIVLAFLKGFFSGL